MASPPSCTSRPLGNKLDEGRGWSVVVFVHSTMYYLQFARSNEGCLGGCWARGETIVSFGDSSGSNCHNNLPMHPFTAYTPQTPMPSFVNDVQGRMVIGHDLGQC